MPAFKLRALELRDEVLTKLTQLGSGTAVTKTGFPGPKLIVLSYQLAPLLGGLCIRGLWGAFGNTDS